MKKKKLEGKLSKTRKKLDEARSEVAQLRSLLEATKKSSAPSTVTKQAPKRSAKKPTSTRRKTASKTLNAGTKNS